MRASGERHGALARAVQERGMTPEVQEPSKTAPIDASSSPLPDDGALRKNQRIAEMLERIAELLEAQDASPFRAAAYHRAAIELRLRREGVRQLFDARGHRGLVELPRIGLSIAATIPEYLESGQMALLRGLEGHAAPEDLFTTLPGIGPALARRLHAELGVETLEDLETAAHDGRLEHVAGFGPRRVQALKALLAERLRRAPRRRRGTPPASPGAPSSQPQTTPPSLAPSVAGLLALDAQYRDRAARGMLPTIAPRRFNPRREAWLPIWHTELDGWHVTALFSNTPLAHQLGTTRDWVIVYYERDGVSGQCTIVTERRGPFAGRRVVRGRELECRDAFESSGPGRSSGRPATAAAATEGSAPFGPRERIHSPP
jgi:DNA polymerase (family 10)